MKINAVSKKKIKNVFLEDGKETFVSHGPRGEKILHIGAGNRKEMTRRKLMLLARNVIELAKSNKASTVTIEFGDFVFPHLRIDARDLAEVLAVNFQMANFQFVRYKTPPPEGWNLVETVEMIGAPAHIKNAFAAGALIGNAVNHCRALTNTPGGEMTPSLFAREAQKAARGTRVKVTILNTKKMATLRMGGVLGVARGSDEKPKFIVMEYWGANRAEKPIVLIGKGVTFDTGGLNLKPTHSIYEMHMDMSGAAAVLSAITLASKLRLKKNVIGLIPAVENMPSGSSYHPGDVLRTMSGKTIEVLDTDAEGRVILADALTYAKQYRPALVVDIATLTSAAMVALGQRASAIFTRDTALAQLLQELGEESGDYVWPLPLWDEYEDDIKGTFGDWANTGKTRYGGAIAGAMFLYQFAKDLLENKKEKTSWVHIDIAPRMTTIDGDHLAKGAAGAPVRLLIQLLRKYR